MHPASLLDSNRCQAGQQIGNSHPPPYDLTSFLARLSAAPVRAKPLAHKKIKNFSPTSPNPKKI